MKSELAKIGGRGVCGAGSTRHPRGGWLFGSSVVLACSLVAAVTRAEVIPTVAYNAVTLLERVTITPEFPFGDDMTLVPITPGVDNILTEFRIRYVASPGFESSASKLINLRLHLLDGDPTSISVGMNTPGTVIFEGSAPVTTAGVSIFDLTGGVAPLLAPDQLAWTVTLSGLEGAESVNWLLGSTLLPGGVGSSLTTYWREVDGEWGLFRVANGLIMGTFSAQALAIPEPGVTSLFAVGGLMLLLARRRQRA